MSAPTSITENEAVAANVAMVDEEGDVWTYEPRATNRMVDRRKVPAIDPMPWRCGNVRTEWRGLGSDATARTA